MVSTQQEAGRERAIPGLTGPFEVYEDYDGRLHIIDGTTRIVLSDVYAYDADDDERLARMEAIAAALSAASPDPAGAP